MKTIDPSKLAAPIPCVQCRYDLRGLNSDGTCPECGNPISHSLDDRLFRFADGSWVKSLRRGASLIFFGILAGFLQDFWVPANSFWRTVRHNVNATWATLTAFAVLMGWWLITQRRPRRTPSLGEIDHFRIPVRAVVTIGFALFVWQLWTVAGQGFGPPPIQIAVPQGLVGIAEAIIIGRFGAAMARSLRAKKICRWVKSVAVASAVSLIWMGITAAAYVLIFHRIRPSHFDTGVFATAWGVEITGWLAWVAIPAATIELLSLIGAFALIVWFRRRLNIEAKLAITYASTVS